MDAPEMHDVTRNRYTCTYLVKITGLRRPLEAEQLEATVRRGMIEHNYDWSSIIATHHHTELSVTLVDD